MALVQLLLCLSILCGQLLAQQPSKGLYPDTRLETPTNLTSIKDLTSGSQVIACQEGHPTTVQVMATKEQEVEELTLLALDEEFVVCGPDQPFLASHGQWIKAKDLRVGDQLATVSAHSVEVRYAKTYSMPGRLCQLSVEHPHNYCVGQCDLIAKNSPMYYFSNPIFATGHAVVIEGFETFKVVKLVQPLVARTVGSTLVGALTNVACLVGGALVFLYHGYRENQKVKELEKLAECCAQQARHDALGAKEFHKLMMLVTKRYTYQQKVFYRELATRQHLSDHDYERLLVAARAGLEQRNSQVQAALERYKKASPNWFFLSDLESDSNKLAQVCQESLHTFERYLERCRKALPKSLPVAACQPEGLRPEPTKTVVPCLPEHTEIGKSQQCGQDHTLQLEDGPCCGSTQRHELQDPAPCGTAENVQDPGLLAASTCGGAKAQELYERGQLSLRKQREKARGSDSFEPVKKEEEEKRRNEIRAGNWGEVFKNTEIGALYLRWKKNIEKDEAASRKKGQPVMRIKEKIRLKGGTELSKGDRLYLDGGHNGDHIEWFNKSENWKGALNLDGTENVKKSEAGKGRKLFD